MIKNCRPRDALPNSEKYTPIISMNEESIMTYPGGGVSTMMDPASRSMDEVKAKIALAFTDLNKFGVTEHSAGSTVISPMIRGPTTFHISSRLFVTVLEYVVRCQRVSPAVLGFRTLVIVKDAGTPGLRTT